MRNEKILFITYFFDPSDGVGSSRSRSLANFLEQNEFKLFILSSKTWTQGHQNIFIWGIKSAIYILKKHKNFNKIYISCGPFLPLLATVIIAEITNKPLIVDFRDAWSLNIGTNYGKLTKKLTLINTFKLLISRLIEKYTYKNCQYFVVCTQGMKDGYASLFKDDSKIKLITNGYDFDPLSCKNNILEEYNDVTKYVCLGKFVEYSENKAYMCLKKIKDKHKDGSSFCIEFIGTNSDKCEPLIRKLNLQENVKFHKPLPYEKALEIASNADFGISIIRDEKMDYGTKVFDYIGLGIPIFDIFEPESNFRKYFASYITDDKMKVLFSLEQIKKFQRSVIFANNINIFEEKVNHENSVPSRT